MRVVVFGASGVQGAAQVEALARTGQHYPVAVSRSPRPVSIDGSLVESIAADFSNPADISEALQGADVLFLNLPSTSFQPAGPILAAARSIAEQATKIPSLRLVVFNASMPIPEIKQNIAAQDHRREIREILRQAGLPVISIQPVAFLENLLEGWALPPIIERNTLVYCHKPDLRVSWICHSDLAQLMIAAMNRPELAGRNIPVGGPETVTLAQLAEKLSSAWKRPMRYETQTVDDFCLKISNAMRNRAGINGDLIASQMHKAYTYYNNSPDKPFLIDMAPVLNELPVKLTPIEDWARSHPVPTSSSLPDC
ncbi:NAD(P)-binding protein [Coniochaeta ligniaria NRRL 30616]|uniref:NAD(P)-binding protein n=1 Tax=Coniochaeta ligniaria NRRL 30616 TaxID=1408157 RepID=A0A1J7J120_9PEZI|nr:NAD(P)-binding protein [Coniochaeta ligniaria NRRL 30616]